MNVNPEPPGPSEAPDAEPCGADGGAASAPTEPKADEPKKSAATRLVELAEDRYDLGCALDGEPFAVPKKGPVIVRLLRGGGQSLRSELADVFYDAYGAAPSQSALADACAVLEGKAQRKDRAALHLRVAAHEGRLILDLGDTTGRAVIIGAAGWHIVERPPVWFRRTALTGALPEPVRGGRLDELWGHLNVAERYRPILAAVLVSALFPDIPHPAVLFTGEQGTGKSTSTKRAASILDPSPAQLRKPPRDADTATTAAAGSWMPAPDNLSSMPDWLSDSICRWCTGDGDVRRRLYTDGDLHVISFRRVPILNGIDLGALRGDLADRTVHLELARIPDGARRDEAEMAQEWERDHPRVLGAILDLTVQVLGILPTVKLAERPRMADFAKILAAVDKHLGTTGLDTYLNLRTELAQDAATSDPLLLAMADRIKSKFEGTSSELLAQLEPGDDPGWRAPKGWPASARTLTGLVKRHAPTLRRLEWEVDELDRNSTRDRRLRWRIRPPAKDEQGGDPRSAAKRAAHAALPQTVPFPQLNGHAVGAANGAATVRQNGRDAAGAANAASTPHDAADFAAPTAQALTSGNEDHAASAANAARSAHLLALDERGERQNGAVTGRWRVSGDPIDPATTQEAP